MSGATAEAKTEKMEAEEVDDGPKPDSFFCPKCEDKFQTWVECAAHLLSSDHLQLGGARIKCKIVSGASVDSGDAPDIGAEWRHRDSEFDFQDAKYIQTRAIKIGNHEIIVALSMPGPDKKSDDAWSPNEIEDVVYKLEVSLNGDLVLNYKEAMLCDEGPMIGDAYREGEHREWLESDKVVAVLDKVFGDFRTHSEHALISPNDLLHHHDDVTVAALPKVTVGGNAVELSSKTFELLEDYYENGFTGNAPSMLYRSREEGTCWLYHDADTLDGQERWIVSVGGTSENIRPDKDCTVCVWAPASAKTNPTDVPGDDWTIIEDNARDAKSVAARVSALFVSDEAMTAEAQKMLQKEDSDEHGEFMVDDGEDNGDAEVKESDLPPTNPDDDKMDTEDTAE